MLLAGGHVLLKEQSSLFLVQDGKIDYEEFVAMMRHETIDKGPSIRQRRVR